MDKYILFISSLILISVLTIIIWFIVITYFRDRENEFIVNFNVLTTVIELYKETILISKIHALQIQYDLNDQSKTNSRQAFERAKNELISETCKLIMKDYLSKQCKNSLLKYYGPDGLSLLIITHLKRR